MWCSNLRHHATLAAKSPQPWVKWTPIDRTFGEDLWTGLQLMTEVSRGGVDTPSLMKNMIRFGQPEFLRDWVGLRFWRVLKIAWFRVVWWFLRVLAVVLVVLRLFSCLKMVRLAIVSSIPERGWGGFCRVVQNASSTTKMASLGHIPVVLTIFSLRINGCDYLHNLHQSRL